MAQASCKVAMPKGSLMARANAGAMASNSELAHEPSCCVTDEVRIDYCSGLFLEEGMCIEILRISEYMPKACYNMTLLLGKTGRVQKVTRSSVTLEYQFVHEDNSLTILYPLQFVEWQASEGTCTTHYRPPALILLGDRVRVAKLETGRLTMISAGMRRHENHVGRVIAITVVRVKVQFDYHGGPRPKVVSFPRHSAHTMLVRWSADDWSPEPAKRKLSKRLLPSTKQVKVGRLGQASATTFEYQNNVVDLTVDTSPSAQVTDTSVPEVDDFCDELVAGIMHDLRGQAPVEKYASTPWRLKQKTENHAPKLDKLVKGVVSGLARRAWRATKTERLTAMDTLRRQYQAASDYISALDLQKVEQQRIFEILSESVERRKCVL